VGRAHVTTLRINHSRNITSMARVVGSLNQGHFSIHDGAAPLSSKTRKPKRRCGSAFNKVVRRPGEWKRNKQTPEAASKESPAARTLSYIEEDEALIFHCLDSDSDCDTEEEQALDEEEMCSGGVADTSAGLVHQLDCYESFEDLVFPPDDAYKIVSNETQVQKAVSQDSLKSLSMDQLEALVNRESVLAIGGHTVTVDVIAKLDAMGFGRAARQQMVTWLMKVQSSVKLTLLCLATAVHLLYRFLARAPSALNQINLIVLTCLWVSSKLHETRALTLDELSAYLPKENSIEDMLACERLLTKTLDFRLVCSTALEVAHQTLALSRDLAHSSRISSTPVPSSGLLVNINSHPSVNKYMDYILDSCLLDEQNWKFKATTKGAASVLAAHEYADIDCTHLRAKVTALGKQQMAALPACERRFGDLLNRAFGPRAVSPVSIFGVSSMA